MSKSYCIGLLASLLVGCGGGGGSTAPAVPASAATTAPVVDPVAPVTPVTPVTPVAPVAPATPDPVPAPALAVTLSAPAQSLLIGEGGSGALTFVATVTGASTRPVVPVITFDDRRLVLQGAIDTSIAGQYKVTLATLPDPAGGKKISQFSFQLCEDAACARPHANTLQTLPLSVTVTLADWGTAQRDGAHRGYVPLDLDPAAFQQAWSWWPPQSARFNPVATGGGKVFVTSSNYAADMVYALDEQTSAVQWSYANPDFEPQTPAYANGTLYTRAAEVLGNLGNYSIWAFDAATGAIQRRIPLTYSGYGLAPVVDAATIYVDAGYFSDGIGAYAVADGTRRWQVSDGYASYSTPALDQARLYTYNGAALQVYRRTDGALLATVADPYAVERSNSREVHATPILGSNGNVLTLSGTQYTGYCCANADGGSSRPIVNFAVAAASGTVLWKTDDTYLTHPALHAGVLYAGTGSIYNGAVTGYTARFDAISEATGKVLWSWSPPAPDMSFYHNVVVTKNLAFVSTDQKVYAIDLTTHKAVWQAPYPGSLAIGAGGVLVIATGVANSDGRVVGIKLQ